MSRRQPFLNIRTEGAMLPPDLLARLLEGTDLTGTRPEDYHLGAGEKLNEAISRSWTRLQSLWGAFQKSRGVLSPTDLGTSLTREKWLLQLFQELGYGRLLAASPHRIEDKDYALSHVWHGQHYQVLAHLVSFRAELDKRSDQRIQGASKASPHSLVQEFLNRSEAHLWAFVSNGLKLRLLRDNTSLTRQAYVEFDLEGIFEGEAYADFRLLWMLCHQSRVEGTAKDRPETCWLEVWSKLAHTEGRRALDQLRDGVEQALTALGTGFIDHKANQALRDRLKAGELQKSDYYRQLLRLVYRLIFLFVAEDRDLLCMPGASEEARSRYARFYSGQRLRRMAERSRGGRHGDLWVTLRLVFSKLGDDRGCPELGLPALGGFLFGVEALPDLEDAELSNEHLLAAIRHLGLVRDRSGWRLVDYRNLGSEELGSIYESLLELSPTMELDAGRFSLAVVGGNERKTTGSYYTPDSLIQCLLDSALDPVLSEAAAKPHAEKAILALKVCDPACGSGHFLIAAAHRIANRLASVRTGDEAPTPDAHRSALRDVIGHCLFGVDLNPMAVELCKVNLWLEALESGKPLSFLDAHIQCGNSLLGTTPELIAHGLPDEAFVHLEGDDKAVVSDLKKRNKKERQGTEKRKSAKPIATPLFSGLGTSYGPMIDGLSKEFEVLESVEDQTLAAVHAKETRYKAMQTSEAWKHAKLVADAWCAAFVWEKTKARLNDEEGAVPITHDDIQRIIQSPVLVSQGVRDEIDRLSNRYGFLHPHIAFPHVFHPSGGSGDWASGFDAVLGNPPWERIKIQEKEWFATKHPGIAGAPNAAIRKQMIQDLKASGDPLYAAFALDLRKADGESHLVRNSGAYPLCGQGDINTYSVFAELMRRTVAPNGMVGVVVPSGIATDDTTKAFFNAITSSHTLASLFSFENEEFLFPGVHHSTKFSLLTMSGPLRHFPLADFVCFARQVEDLQDSERRFSLSGEDLVLLNPNTGTCAVFRTRQDAELTKAIYQRVPVLIREAQGEQPEVNPWGLSFQAMLHMANDSSLFHEEADLLRDGWAKEGNHFVKGAERYLALYEAKMLHHFDHRFGTYEGQTEAQANQGKLPEFTPEQHADPALVSQPYYWVQEQAVKLRAADLPRAVLKALENGKEEDLLKALGTWALGGVLLAETITAPIPDLVIKTVWNGLRESIPSLHLLDIKDLDPLKGVAQAKEYPFTDAERSILESHPSIQDAGEALLEARTPRWFIGWRDITLVSNQRTLITSVLPLAGIGHTFPIMKTKMDADMRLFLQANLSSYVLDYVTRQKIGGTHMTYGYLNQLAILPPDVYLKPTPWAPKQSIREWMFPRVLELVYSSWDLQSIAEDCGYEGPPFIWDEERRFQLRCELDAAFFHLYGLTRDEVAFVMDTFPIVRRKDEAAHASYRTRDDILSAFNAMAEAIRTGRPYQSRLDPPPADPRCCHSDPNPDLV